MRYKTAKADWIRAQVPADMARQLKVLARKEDRSVSSIVRIAVRRYLDERRAEERGANGRS